MRQWARAVPGRRHHGRRHSVSDPKTDLPKLRARIGMVFSIKGVRVDAARRYD
jgi:hypothetical protein